MHFDRRLDSDIPRSRWSAKAPLYAELKARDRAVLYAPTYDEACRLFAELGRERARFTLNPTLRTERRSANLPQWSFSDPPGLVGPHGDLDPVPST